jgi:hypothetical protein
MTISAICSGDIKMKSLIERLFKKESPINYTIADYQPVKIKSLKTNTVTEYQIEIEQLPETDEMDIDRIYQNS